MQDHAFPKQTLTVEEFLKWAGQRPREAGRFELWDGRIVEKHVGTGSVKAEQADHRRTK